jgi:hypothetical protein
VHAVQVVALSVCVSSVSIDDHAHRITWQREVARHEPASVSPYPAHFGLQSCLLCPPDRRFDRDAFQV